MAAQLGTHEKAFCLEEATIDELHASIQSGQTICVAIVQHYIDRVRAYNGVASALVTKAGAPVPDAPGAVRAGAAALPDRYGQGLHEPARSRQVHWAAPRIRPHGLQRSGRRHWAISAAPGAAIPPTPTTQHARPRYAGLTEVLIPAGYVTTVYDPICALRLDGACDVSVASDMPTTIAAPGFPFFLVFRAEPGKKDVLLQIASAYEAAS